MRADEIGEYIYIYEYQINGKKKGAIKVSLTSLNSRLYCFNYFGDSTVETTIVTMYITF